MSETDARVGSLLQAGESDAAVTLVLETYGPELLGFLTRALGDEHQAAEVFSLVAEDVWRGLPGFQFRSSLRTWLYAISRRATARYLRSGKLGPLGGVPLSRAPAVQALAEQIRTQTAPYLRTEIKDRFASVRARLEPDERMLLTLRHDKGLRWREIAQVMLDEDDPDEAALERKTDALKKRYKRLLPKIKTLAKEEGLLDAPE
jgi:RNA polymerase sigma-70 factor, ECF subfamily